MDKQKKIEEMKEIEKELDKVYPNAKFTNGWIAEVFYKLGYRKIHENAVVLTREELERIKGFSREEVDEISETAINNSRKKTAEKFAEMAKERKIEMGTDGHSYCMVFVEDIDEICKEFTENKV